MHAWFSSHNSPVFGAPSDRERHYCVTELISSRSLVVHQPINLYRCYLPIRAVSPVVSMWPLRRNDRANPPRFTAAVTQLSVRCTHAPRPGIVADESTTTTESCNTTLVREARSSRPRQPIQVLTGFILPQGYDNSSMRVSLFTSIFARVNIAARRAFCPSLPIANDSWYSGTKARTALVASSINTAFVTFAGDSA